MRSGFQVESARGASDLEEASLTQPIPAATVARLPHYVRALDGLLAQDRVTVSSQELAEAAGIQSALLRRDLSYFGSLGVRGVGYDVASLRAKLGGFVGAEEYWPLIIMGAGNLGTALARQFSKPPFVTVAVVDSNPELVGQKRGEVQVTDQAHLRAEVARTGALIGIVCVPPEAAQSVADALVDAGIRSLLNFAPIPINVPDGVNVRRVDLAQELSILAFHEQHRRHNEDLPISSDVTQNS